MKRREYLAAAAGLPVLGVGTLAGRGDTGRTAEARSARRRTTTANATTTPTPTRTVATPSTGYEPLGTLTLANPYEGVPSADGRYAFVAGGDGFVVVDLRDPTAPSVAARVGDVRPAPDGPPMAEAWDLSVDGDRLLLAGPAGYDESVFNGAALFDVSDPTDPAFLRAHATEFPVHNCTLADGYAYLTGNDRADNPLVVVDVSGDPAEVARWSAPGYDEGWRAVKGSLRILHDVWVQGDYAYLAYWDLGTWVLDVSDPAAPAYVANVTARDQEKLANIGGYRALRERGEPPGNVHYVRTDPDGDLLAVGRETWNSNFGKDENTPSAGDPGGPSGITLYDVSDPERPAELSTIDPPPTADPNYAGVWTTAHNFDLRNGHLYSAWYRGGLRVHDVSDPGDPVQVAHFRRSRETSFWTAQLARPGEVVFGVHYRDPQDVEGPGALYAFPDPAGGAGTTTAGTPSPGGTAAGTTPDPTAAPTPTGSPTRTGRSATDGDGSPATGSGPGFGPVAALAGLGLGAWRVLRGEGGAGDGDD